MYFCTNNASSCFEIVFAYMQKNSPKITKKLMILSIHNEY